MSTLVILRNQRSSQNLVESTKLERTVTDSKSERRKERKEKKEKRKLKKEKHEKSRKHSSRKADDDLDNSSKKKVSDASDQLEKSGLTEELEEPQNQLGYLSDGSQNSKKRKRDDSPPAVESLIKVAAAPLAGNPLRIRLIFKKPREAVPTLPREDHVCSTSVAKPQEGQQDVISKVSEPEENLPPTSSVAAAIVETIKRKKHKPSKEERYNALFDDWTPSSICFAAGDPLSKDDDDDEWLFGKKTQENLNPKAAGTKIDEDISLSLHRPSRSSWPKAQFLSGVGIYSLPFTVPF